MPQRSQYECTKGQWAMANHEKHGPSNKWPKVQRGERQILRLDRATDK